MTLSLYNGEKREDLKRVLCFSPNMFRDINFTDTFYRSPRHLSPGLEALVRFPDGDVKHRDIPNSTVWVYGQEKHSYHPEILQTDVGCGIAAFFINEVDSEEAADRIYQRLKRENVFGRGNHFVDVCSAYESSAVDSKPQPLHNILLVHTHGNTNQMPMTIRQAQERQREVESFRKEFGEELASLIGASSCNVLGNWTHNLVEEDCDKIIYRKGVVRVIPEKVHILPAHLGERILFYTVSDKHPFQLPPYASMPHATGRKGPLGMTKVSLSEVSAMRKDPLMPYIPPKISDASLRSEHPSCFNDYAKIMERLQYKINTHFDNKFFIPLGQCRILSYVGKV